MSGDLVMPYRYRASIDRVVDGDTLDLVVDLGLETARDVRVRVYGVDTPEHRGAERPAGLRATEWVVGWLNDADHLEKWPLVVDTHKDSTGKFGRWLADVYRVSDGRSLAVDLIESGHAEVLLYD